MKTYVVSIPALLLAVSSAVGSVYRPGLLQGKANAQNSDFAVTGFERVLGPYMADSTDSALNPITGTTWSWNGENTTFAYVGEMYLAEGQTITFGKALDDGARVTIAGTILLDNGVWNDFVTGSYTASSTGWVPVDIRIWDGNGGKGPSGTLGSLGLGINFEGATDASAAWSPVREPGDMSFLRVSLDESFTTVVSVEDDLAAPRFTLRFDGVPAPAALTACLGDNDCGPDASAWPVKVALGTVDCSEGPVTETYAVAQALDHARIRFFLVHEQTDASDMDAFVECTDAVFSPNFANPAPGGAWRPGLIQAKSDSNNDFGFDILASPTAEHVLGTLVADTTGSAQNPVTGNIWSWNDSNTTFGYTGEMYLAAGQTVTFGKHLDDGARITIGGRRILDDGTWNAFVTGSFTASSSGWVPVDIRICDGSGGKGPANQGSWDTTQGLGYNLDGVTDAQPQSNWSHVFDPGDLSVFRVPAPDISVSAGSPSVDAGAATYTLTFSGIPESGAAVTAYLSNYDQGPAEAGWTESVAAGTVPGGAGTAAVTVPGATAYRYVRLRLDNLASEDVPSRFVAWTGRLMTVPTPAVSLDALREVTATSVTLSATLGENGGDGARLVFVVDEADEERNFMGWDNRADIAAPAPGEYSATVSGLSPGKVYYATVLGTNSAAQVGSDEAGAVPFITAPVSVSVPAAVLYDDDSVGLTIVFSRPASASGCALDVTYGVAGDAVAGTDYTGLGGSFAFAPGETTHTEKILPVDHPSAGAPANGRSVVVTVQPGLYFVDSTGTASFSILDESFAVPEVYTWTGAAGDLRFDNPLNWDANAVPGSRDIARFTDAGLTRDATVSWNTSRTVGKILIETTTSFRLGSPADQAAGAVLTLTDFERRDVEGTEGWQAFTGPVALLGDADGVCEFSISGSDKFEFAGDVHSATATPPVLRKTGPAMLCLTYTGMGFNGVWEILEGDLNPYNDDVLAGTVKIGGGAAEASFDPHWWNSPLRNDVMLEVYSNGVAYVNTLNYQDLGGIHVHEGGVAYFANWWIYSCNAVHLTGGSVLRFDANSYGRLFQNALGIYSHASGTTATNEMLLSAADWRTLDISVEDGPAPVDLVQLGYYDRYDIGYGIAKSGAGTLVVGYPATFYNLQEGETGYGWRINEGRAIFDTGAASGAGQNPVAVNAGAILGGTGLLGGEAAFDGFHVRVQGSADAPARIQPGSVSYTTGESLCGRLTVGDEVKSNYVLFNANSALDAQIGVDGAADELYVNGTVAIDPAAVLTIEVAPEAEAGTYALVTATGGLSGTFSLPDDFYRPGNVVYTATQVLYTVPPATTVILFR